MNQKHTNLNWKPVRKGKMFCSPGCGRRCTWLEHQNAAWAALLLAKQMGVGWKPYVWENLGWHYGTVSPCGRLSILASSAIFRHSFTAFLGEPNSPGCGQWAQSSKTPDSAKRAVIKLAKKDLARIGATLNGL